MIVDRLPKDQKLIRFCCKKNRKLSLKQSKLLAKSKSDAIVDKSYTTLYQKQKRKRPRRMRKIASREKKRRLNFPHYGNRSKPSASRRREKRSSRSKNGRVSEIQKDLKQRRRKNARWIQNRQQRL